MTVNLTDLTNPSRLRAMYESNTSVMLQGKPGTAKSSVARIIPELLSDMYGEKFGYWEQLLPSIDAPDVRGFMIPAKDDAGRAIAKYTYPAILPPIDYLKEHPRGVLFLDEVYQADYLTQKGCAPLILEKKVGDYSLPEGWWVICASNRMADKSGVAKPLMHVINRMRVLDIQLPVDTWMDWAQDNGIHPMGIAFAKQHPSVVFDSEVPKDPEPFCTPRSFTSAMKLMMEIAGDDMNLPGDTLTQEMVMGDIGQAAAARFFGWIKVADLLPTIEEIMTDPQGAKCPPDERLDAAFAAQQLIVYHSRNADDFDTIDKMWQYVERLPRELATSTAEQLLRHKGVGLLNTPRLGKWITKNGGLIMSSVEK